MCDVYNKTCAFDMRITNNYFPIKTTMDQGGIHIVEY